MRLGLCCLFKEADIRFKTTTVRYVSTLSNRGKEPLDYLGEIALFNVESLLQAISFCSENGIGSFRVNSALLPISTHPQFGYQIDDLPNSVLLYQAFEKVKNIAKERDIRLTFHPDQFVVLNSPRDEVVESAIKELEHHAVMAKLIGADVITIHGGGGYHDKPLALVRFKKHFERLSFDVQSRLAIENDDRVFTPSELLPLASELNIPFIYDVHHHRCLPDALTTIEVTKRALETWNREPLFHLSSPKEGWKEGNPRLHHDLIDIRDVPDEWKEIDALTIDIEAKAKEIAVLKLRRELLERGWKVVATHK